MENEKQCPCCGDADDEGRIDVSMAGDCNCCGASPLARDVTRALLAAGVPAWIAEAAGQNWTDKAVEFYGSEGLIERFVAAFVSDDAIIDKDDPDVGYDCLQDIAIDVCAEYFADTSSVGPSDPLANLACVYYQRWVVCEALDDRKRLAKLLDCAVKTLAQLRERAAEAVRTDKLAGLAMLLHALGDPEGFAAELGPADPAEVKRILALIQQA